MAVARDAIDTLGAVLVAALIVAAAVVIAIRLSGAAAPIDTDIMALVPQAERDPVLAASIDRASRLVAGRVVLLLDDGSGAMPAAAAADLEAELEASGVWQSLDDEAGALWRWLFAHRAHLLCPDDRALLEGGRGAVIAADAMARIHASLLPLPGRLLRDDPLLLTLRLVDCLMPRGPGQPGTTLVHGRLDGSAFALDVQDRLDDAIAAWQARHAGSGIALRRAGAVFHAAEGAATARLEITWVSLVSLAVTTAVFVVLFARMRAALLALGTMLIGVTGGLAACLLVFSQVHALALLIGAAMTGIGVDYAIHVMAAGRACPLPRANPAGTIARPLGISLCTTLTALAFLGIAGVELLRQIALFGAAGLLLSFGFSRFVLWRLHRPSDRLGAPAAWFQRLASGLLGWSADRRLAWPAAVLLALVLVPGWRALVTTDDVRGFQARSATLVADEQAIAAASGSATESRFLLLRAADAAGLAAVEAAVVGRLDHPLPAPAWLDPPARLQAADHALLEERLFAPELASVAASLGLDPDDLYPDAVDGSAIALPAPFDRLRGRAAGVSFSIVPLAPDDLAMLERTALPEGAELVDPASVYSTLLARLRWSATLGLGLALLAAATGLFVIRRDWSGPKLLLPTGLALLLVPAIAGLVGQTVSLFSVMGLLMALGLGIDYAAFQAIDRSPSVPSRDAWREAGILAAAVTTITPMTVLAFSTTLPVGHFGLAVALGAALSLILSPLARGGRRQGAA